MAQVDRDALMRAVVSVYAEQLLIDGLFNADPHAGNIHVHVDGHGKATPVCDSDGHVHLPNMATTFLIWQVLLDFGMTVRLSDHQRLGYARLALAAHQCDLHALQQASCSKLRGGK